MTNALPKILQVVMRTTGPNETSHDGRIHVVNQYDFPTLDLTPYTSIFVNAGADQVHLAKHTDTLVAFLTPGHYLLVNGHPVQPFLPGMPTWRKYHFKGVDDVWLHEVTPHPLFANVDRKAVLLRTGVPGDHTFEEMLKIGVAGFYARNYLADLPEDAIVMTGMGPQRLPVDVQFRAPNGGTVIMHCGNDLISFDKPAFFPEQIIQFFGGGADA